MKISLRLAAVASVLAAALLSSAPALAQRVFVAAQGSDSNPCTFALPCRSFQHAHDVVAAGGEIDVLDPAGYGLLSISKSISIQGHGFAGIGGGGASGITINAGATDAVNLNGLLIEGNGVGAVGIDVFSGSSFIIQNCAVHHLVRGLRMTSVASTAQTLFVSDSSFTDATLTGNAAVIGTGSSGAIMASFVRVAFTSQGDGLVVDGGSGTGAITVSVSDSIATNVSGNSGVGFIALSSAGHSAIDLTLLRTTSSGNTRGIRSNGPTATIRIAQSSLTGNATGYEILNGGTILSYGDNYIDANGGNTGTLGPATKQ
jgi:hypothetical protein